ncbi:MAG: PAS domain-containing sensor histidine kinase [Desulfomonilaceae bacterium]
MKNKTTEQTIEELKKIILKLDELQVAQSTLVDIAELEQAIKDLKRKTQEQELLLNTIDTQIWYLTDPWTYGMVNQSRADFLGKRREEIEGKRLDDFYSHDVAAVCEVGNAEAFQTGRTVHTEEWFPNAAGESRLISITKTPKLDEHGKVEYVVCAGADITERKQTQDTLRENEQRLKFAIEGGALGMWDWDTRTGWGVWDEGIIRMLGYELGELDSHIRTWKRHIHPDDWGRVSEVLNEHLSGRLPFFEAEYRMRTKSGEYRWFFSRNKVVEHDKDGKPQRITGTIFDVTERRRAEEALKQSEENFRIIVEGAPDAVFVQTGGLFAYLNPSALNLFGANSSDDLLGKPIMDRYHPRFHDITKERIQLVNVERKQAPPLEEIWLRMDGSEVSVDVSAVPIKFLGQDGALVFARDLTERKEVEQEKQALQAQLIQSQKMETLGTLVGGIAHDFNNMLQVILGYSQLLLGDKKEGDMGYKDLETIIQTSREGAEMVNKLLAFGQQAPIFPVDLDLNHQIRELIPLIFRTLPEIVKIDVDLTPGPAMIHADPSQIDQVIMNLAINASEAMPNGGRLNIVTTTVSLNKEYCGSYPEVKPGDYVMLLMSDTGRGMDKKTLARAFEPYFSTKQRGSIKGTGP